MSVCVRRPEEGVRSPATGNCRWLCHATVWVLGTEAWLSVRAASAANCSASLQLQMPMFPFTLQHLQKCHQHRKSGVAVDGSESLLARGPAVC